jgi:hypothetical protein
MRLGDALQELRPAAQWVAYGDTYEDIIWLDEVQSKPTKEEVLALLG